MTLSFCASDVICHLSELTGVRIEIVKPAGRARLRSGRAYSLSG